MQKQNQNIKTKKRTIRTTNISGGELQRKINQFYSNANIKKNIPAGKKYIKESSLTMERTIKVNNKKRYIKQQLRVAIIINKL